MVGADRDGFSTADALALSRAADACLMDRLTRAAERACDATIGRPTAAVIAGSGDFLALRLARCLIAPAGPVVSLKQAWGEIASSAGCAFALVQLASEHFHPVSGAIRHREPDPSAEPTWS
jgi:hypothetical protein